MLTLKRELVRQTKEPASRFAWIPSDLAKYAIGQYLRWQVGSVHWAVLSQLKEILKGRQEPVGPKLQTFAFWVGLPMTVALSVLKMCEFAEFGFGLSFLAAMSIGGLTSLIVTRYTFAQLDQGLVSRSNSFFGVNDRDELVEGYPNLHQIAIFTQTGKRIQTIQCADAIDYQDQMEQQIGQPTSSLSRYDHGGRLIQVNALLGRLRIQAQNTILLLQLFDPKLIGSIKLLVTSETELLVITGDRKLRFYSRDGDFLRKSKLTGVGHLYMDRFLDFQLDRQDQLVALYQQHRRSEIVIFDLNGQLLHEVRHHKPIRSFAITSTGTIFAESLRGILKVE